MSWKTVTWDGYTVGFDRGICQVCDVRVLGKWRKESHVARHKAERDERVALFDVLERVKYLENYLGVRVYGA